MALIQSYIASNRFGFGATIDELEEHEKDPRGWLVRQIFSPHKHKILDEQPSAVSVFREISDMMSAHEEENMHMEFHKKSGEIHEDGIYARTVAAIESTTPFYERLVHFWSNHFTVSSTTTELKSFKMKSLVGAFENEAIRPNVTGNFRDLLIAAESHPAMLYYLDNVHSVGDNSSVGKKRKDLSLNENLAREILELHTLGVNGGYKQKDVEELAKIITGWTINYYSSEEQKGFKFKKGEHEPGPKKLLDKTYSENGSDEGVEALSDIANHPSTAKFIAKKLATHFLSDKPSQKSITHLANAFIHHNGDLSRVYMAMFELPEAWSQKFNKVKTPNEFVISASRAMGRGNEDSRKFLIDSFRHLGQIPFSAGGPDGWSDQSDDWLGGEAVMRRIEWANLAGKQFSSEVSVEELAKKILGPVLTDETSKAIRNTSDKQEQLALLFASPEFQMR